MHLNDNPIHQVQFQKGLGLFLDSKLHFEEHIQCILNKTNKIIESIRRPHLDYGDVFYVTAFNESFENKLESGQYNVTVAIKGTIRGSSIEKPYQELGLELLKFWRRY